MSNRLRDLPELTGSNLTEWARAVKEAIQTFRGYRGDPRDRALTPRDLTAEGLAALGGVAGGTIIGGGSGGTGGGGGDPVPELTPPPTPTGLVVTAGISHIYIACDTPLYVAGRGHDRTVVYGAKWPVGGIEPTFTGAVELSQFLGTFEAYPTDPATRWCIWIKWKSKDGVLSSAPAGGTNGAQATTAYDPALLKTALTGVITESELFSTLGARISLIDGPDSLAGSVAARVLAEATARGAAVASEASTRSSADTAIASSVTSLASTVGGNTAAITAEATTRANADTAISSTVTTLSSTVSGNTAAIATEVSTRASQTGALFAQWTVKLDLNGYVSGFGLASTGGSAAPTSSFIVRADSFAVASPSGPGITPAVPFIVRTTPGTVNGVSYPAGVYMDSAFILDLTAAIARMGTAWIDDAKIATLSAAKLTVGDGTVGGDLKSTTFTAGSGSTPGTGWRLTPAGDFRASGATIYGTIYASAGVFAGSLSAATGTFVGSITAGGVELGADVGPGGGHYGLSLSGTDFSNIFLKRGDGVVFFRLNDGGAQSLTFDSSSGQLTMNGTLRVGSSPAISGTTMTGSGAVINADGTAAIGNSTRNITIAAGGAAYLNGEWVFTSNLGTGAVTTDKIASLNVDKLNAGSLAVGGYIQSTTYSAGTAGWRISADGFAEFGAASIRGQITAAQINTTGLTIGYGAVTGTPTSLAAINGTEGTKLAGIADGATRNTVTYSASAPGSPVNGDLWVDTSGAYAVFKLRSAGSWVTGANALDAYNALSGKPVSLADINTTESTKLAGIAAGATVGAAWASNLTGRPGELTDGRITTAIDSNGVMISKAKPGLVAAPTTSGLYLGADFMGYYSAGTTSWRTYMDNTGRFYLGGTSGALQWDGSTLTINGNGTFSGALSAATGTFSGNLSAAGGTFAGSLSAATGSFAGSLSAATGTFSGALSGATGTFSGSLTVGSSPAVSGTTMTGSGGVINSGGTFALGNSTTNITFNGTVMKMNGAWITEANLSLTGLSVTLSTYSAAVSGPFPLSVDQAVTATASGGTPPYAYLWNLNQTAVNGSSGSSLATFGATATVSGFVSSAGGDVSATATCTAIDANGRVGSNNFSLVLQDTS